MGLDSQQQPLSVRASGDVGAALGNRNLSNTQNKEITACFLPSLFINKGPEMLTFEMFLLSGKPVLAQPVPCACVEQPP